MLQDLARLLRLTSKTFDILNPGSLFSITSQNERVEKVEKGETLFFEALFSKG